MMISTQANTDAPAGIVLDEQLPAGSLAEYLSAEEADGVRVVRCESGNVWTDYFEAGMAVRIPMFLDAPVSQAEASHVLRQKRKPLLNYIIRPDDQHRANAFSYVCADQDYCLEKLSSNMRRDARRGLRELTVGPISLAQVRAHGLPLFIENRVRHGLADGNAETFNDFLRPATTRPGRAYFGAWAGDRLAAFIDVLQLDDWVEIEGSYSLREFQRLTPNDAILYYSLDYYLRRRRASIVSIGVSSIESTGREASLHKFKQKVGFVAMPVHRAFVLHPWLRPFANRFSLAGLRLASRVAPGHRRLRKATAMLARMLGEAPSTPLASTDHDEQQ